MQILKDFHTIYTKCKIVSKAYLDLYCSNLQCFFVQFLLRGIGYYYLGCLIFLGLL